MLAVYIEYQKDLPQMKNINHTALNMDKDVFNTALDKLSNERYITTENIKPTPEGLLYAEKYFGIQKYDTAAEKIEYIIKKCGTPKPGDIIFYDWQDNGIGDNIGATDHVGIVENVINNVIVVIEGNKNNAVERREIQINGRYIRGFGVPKYTSAAVTELTTVNDIVWELAHRGILTDKQYWLKKLAEDKNVYCLAKNIANYRP